MTTTTTQAVTDAEIAKLREKHGITSNGRGIKEFTQIVSFARDVLEAASRAPAVAVVAEPVPDEALTLLRTLSATHLYPKLRQLVAWFDNLATRTAPPSTTPSEQQPEENPVYLANAASGSVQALLYEHEDGRYAVNPDTAGDPKWHRLGPVTVPVAETMTDADLEPPEQLAGRLIDAWCAAHGKQIPWAKAIEITAIVTKMPDAERERLLNLDNP